MPNRFRQPLLAGAVVLMTLAAYVPAMRAGFIWDDNDYVTENPTLRTADGLRRIWLEPGAVPQYYPLVHTAFWVEYHLWRDWACGYHVVNVLLHACSAILLWVVLRRLKVPGAWLAGAIFALHPVHVESAAWITERKNVLSGAFYLGAMLACLRFFHLAGAPVQGRRRWAIYALSMGLFLCALLSKTVTATLPAAVLLLIWWKRGRIRWREAAATIPFFAVGVCLSLLTIWLEKHRVGAVGEEWSLSPLDRILVAGRALWFYAWKLLVPWKLTFIYPRWQVSAGVWWQYLFPAAAGGVIVCLFLLRRRIGRGPVVSVLFFAGTLAPALGFFDVFPMRYSFVADHFQYLASAGLIAVFGAAGVRLLGRIAGAGRAGVATRFSTAGVLLAGLGTLTWLQGRIYKDQETLWTDTIDKNPDCWMAYHNLGILRLRQGDVPGGIRSFRECLRRKPDHSDAHSDLGAALISQGNLPEGIEHLQEAIRLEPTHPTAHNNLGKVLASQGKWPEAAEHFRAATRQSPDFADALNNLALAMSQQGDIDQAIGCYRRSLSVDPDQPDTRAGLGDALFRKADGLIRKGDLVLAGQLLAEVIRLDPNRVAAHYNLGKILSGQGRHAEAIREYREALRLDPNLPEAMNNLAWLLAASEDAALRSAAEAVQLAEQLCRLTDYRSPVALDTMAAAYAEAGRFSDAIRFATVAADLAGKSGSPELAAEVRGRLLLYQSGKPYREKLDPLPAVRPEGGG